MSEPAYLQVALDIREQIKSGQLKPGDKLPSFNALRQHYEVSGTVIRTAMILLKAEGILDGKQGKGVYVTNLSPES